MGNWCICISWNMGSAKDSDRCIETERVNRNITKKRGFRQEHLDINSFGANFGRTCSAFCDRIWMSQSYMQSELHICAFFVSQVWQDWTCCLAPSSSLPLDFPSVGPTPACLIVSNLMITAWNTLPSQNASVQIIMSERWPAVIRSLS